MQLLAEPIQRADVPDLATAIRERSILDGSSPTPDEARRLVEEFERACDAWQYPVAKVRADSRTALLRALGVEA